MSAQVKPVDVHLYLFLIKMQLKTSEEFMAIASSAAPDHPQSSKKYVCNPTLPSKFNIKNSEIWMVGYFDIEKLFSCLSW